MFPPGGHMGPPLRQMMWMGWNDLTYFLILMPHIQLKNCNFYEKIEESVHALRWYLTVGADLCVRPW